MRDGEIELLPLEPEHLEFLRRLRNDPAMAAQVFSPSIPISTRQQELWYERQLADRSAFIFIASVEGEALVGYGQVKHIDRVNRSVELGCHIAPEHQDKGYGAALMAKLVQFAGTTLNMHRLYLEVLARNERAIHVYEKCGFLREGVLRDKVLKDGRFEDVVVMSIINEICP